MVVTDVTLAQIVEQIASHQPERGGALYGPRNYPLVTHLDFDTDAETTSVSYVPSRRLVERVRKVERETGLKFKGIIHSHPEGLVQPSGGDRRSAANFFAHNPHLSSFAMPIVQQMSPRSSRPPESCVRWYTVERRGRSVASRLWRASSENRPDVEVLNEEFTVLPIRLHFELLLARLRAYGFELKVRGGLQPLQIRHSQLVGLIADSPTHHELMYFVSFDYPIVAPLVLFQIDGTTVSLKCPWDGTADDDLSLHAIADLLASHWGRGSRPDLVRAAD